MAATLICKFFCQNVGLAKRIMRNRFEKSMLRWVEKNTTLKRLSFVQKKRMKERKTDRQTGDRVTVGWVRRTKIKLSFLSWFDSSIGRLIPQGRGRQLTSAAAGEMRLARLAKETPFPGFKSFSIKNATATKGNWRFKRIRQRQEREREREKLCECVL